MVRRISKNVKKLVFGDKKKSLFNKYVKGRSKGNDGGFGLVFNLSPDMIFRSSK